MIEIRLSIQSWSYDPNQQLGAEGGFGAVFYGEDKDKNKVAIKKLHVDVKQAGHRELRLAEEFANRNFKNIIPIYDSGQDSESDSYFIAMAMAEKSLRDDLSNGLQFSDLDTVTILLSVINGLEEVPTIVHRDLKPGNILFHQNAWKVADFGIARFVEESTSLRTLKECLTYPYAAPEQLKLEHSTRQTDIYALGCIGYELLTGSPPFTGPSREDFREQHLHSQPPPITKHSSLLCSLLVMMLRKNPDARPSHKRVRAQLEKIGQESERPSVISSLSELQ